MPSPQKTIHRIAYIHTHTYIIRCHRNLKPGETLTRFERGLLKLINSIYFLPPWVSIETYIDLANKAGLKVSTRRRIRGCPSSVYLWKKGSAHAALSPHLSSPQNVKSADWTDTVKPFWPAVLRSSLSLKSMKVLATSSTVRKGALAILVCMYVRMYVCRYARLTD